jgi:predicted ATP-dependent endonuclease of OLD family
MQILRLKVEKYNILNDFEIEFKDNISVFIGENGSGKSTILEALLLIFRAAHLQFVEGKEKKQDSEVDSPLFVEVEYQINLEYFDDLDLVKKIDEVTLVLKSNNTGYTLIQKQGFFNQRVKELIREEQYEKLLPNKIITYYAGWSDRMETICTKHQKKYREKLSNSKKKVFSTKAEFSKELYIHYIQKQHFDIIFACFTAFKQRIELQKFFQEDLNINIQDIQTINLIIKKGKAKGKSAKDFYGVEGEQLRFLEILKEKSLNNHSTKFSFNLNKWIQVKNELGGGQALFNNLIGLLSLNMIGDISTTYYKRGSEELHQKYLSEGEQQRLTIMGIHEFMADENALILLDEPDVFLHPKWQRDFIYELSKDERPSNHYFITSHSPNILSGLKKEQVFALRKTENSTEIRNIHFNSYGKPVDEILIDFFDVESLRYKTAQDQIDKVWELIKSNKYKEAVFQTEFENLEKMIGKDDSEITSIKIELIRREKRNEKN